MAQSGRPGQAWLARPAILDAETGDEAVQKAHARIPIDDEQIADFCRSHHIHKLALFGSVLRDDFRPASDVDMLVEFEPGHPVGYIALAGMEIELSEIVGREVDLRTAEDLSRYFRQQVIDTAEVLYARR